MSETGRVVDTAGIEALVLRLLYKKVGATVQITRHRSSYLAFEHILIRVRGCGFAAGQRFLPALNNVRQTIAVEIDYSNAVNKWQHAILSDRVRRAALHLGHIRYPKPWVAVLVLKGGGGKRGPTIRDWRAYPRAHLQTVCSAPCI
jgi:hypothetical protein